MPMLCPCHSQAPYVECCRPYHLGAPAPDALRLMRSRYCAYALGLPEYLIRTTHPENVATSRELAAWTAQIREFSKKTSFDDLIIVEFIDGETEAYVTFIARLSQNKKDASFTEKSRFYKVGEQWLYESGVIDTSS